MRWIAITIFFNLNGTILEDVVEFKGEIKRYFESKFKEQYPNRPVLDGVVFKKLEVRVSECIKEEFTMEDIKEAIWSCEGDKCSGPNGYNFAFMRKRCSIMENDIVSYMMEFHRGGRLPKAMTKSF